jgi:hypothetical protein
MSSPMTIIEEIRAARLYLAFLEMGGSAPQTPRVGRGDAGGGEGLR